MSATDDVVFNPKPHVQRWEFAPGISCLVIDDFFLNPDAVREFAVAERAAFTKASGNRYPGMELHMPPAFDQRLDDYFRSHVRNLLGARRTLRMYSRLSMVTLQPDQLHPAQMICHRNCQWVPDNQMVAASVVYLFNDTSLGGTSLFVPKSAHDAALVGHDAVHLSVEAFTQKYQLQPNYLTRSGAGFELVGTVPAHWNRAVFYNGSIFHSGQITAPEKCTNDPATGRLTLNAFFDCTRKAA